MPTSIDNIYQLFRNSTGISTDTRTIKPNQIYFALKGTNFDGNTVAYKALENGAAYAVIDQPEYKKNDAYILVDDVLETLQQLALHHRKQVPLKALIAITGSNGKTTTKELVNAVLATTYKTHYTKGNLNNHIGIPITLLEMPLDTEIAIIEMGANHQKEIDAYCKYVEPTHGIITNIGKAHLEGFGGIEGVKKGKGELFDYLKNNNGLVFYNKNSMPINEIIEEKAIKNTISYGNSTEADYFAEIVETQPFLAINFENQIIHSHLFGSYNFDNILCAIAVGKFFKVANQSIKNAIENYLPTNKRSEVLTLGSNKIICDYYNANPTSMQHALESFSKTDDIHKIVILGDMFELGEYAIQEHQRIADLATALNFDKIILVGENFAQVNTKQEVLKFKTALDTKEWYNSQNFDNSVILLKGSNSMKMGSVIN